jgi:gas vesicle protein
MTILLGTLGGAMAGYLFSNTKLRDELANAKDAEAAGKILAKHLSKDGQQIGKEVQQFVKSDMVQDNLEKTKKYAQSTAKKWKDEMKGFMKKQAPAAKKAMKATAKKAKATAKKHVKKASNFVEKNV